MWQFHKKSRNNKKEIIIKRKTNYYLRKIFYACTHTHIKQQQNIYPYTLNY